MILRAIKVEPLPNEDDEQEPKAAKPGLFSMAKAAMKSAGNNAKTLIPRDPVAGLQKALLPVRAALRKWDEIEAAHNTKCDTSAYTAHLEKARAQFAETHSPEDHGKVFVAQAVLRERRIEADAEQRSKYSGVLELEWMKIPDVRDQIKRACALKIEAIEVELERLRASEQRHLGPKHDANDSPLVKDQAGKVALWEQQLSLLNTRMVVHDPVMEAQRFLAAARLLLENDESAGKKFIHKDDGDIYELLKVDPISDPDLAEFEHTHHLQGTAGKCWSGPQADFEKCFKKL